MRWLRSAVLAATVVAPVGASGMGTASAQSAPTVPATVWLCRPGLAHNPCIPSFTTTTATPTGRVLAVHTAPAASHPKIDCFYVYPTVSDQKTPNADLTIDPTERSIALYQAARYSRDCRVFAPVYRQLTLSAIGGQTTAAESQLAYSDVRQAWETYLRQFNHGRGVVLIGHSQGAFLLRQLISSAIDPHPAMRRLLISAVLLGGNVTVRQGSDVGGDFKHIHACHRSTQVGCVIAFSTFDTVPPTGSLFGRTTAPGLKVLCTNPAALGGGSGSLDPIFPTQPFAPGSTIAAGIQLLGYTVPKVNTPWVSSPGAYSATCSSAGGANVLEITPRSGAPVIHPSPDATWGLHLVDANIALGNLIGVVHSEALAYGRLH
ncbi:MAG: DUF3089 domain-containing protein [Acidimicrobiales bacterium]